MENSAAIGKFLNRRLPSDAFGIIYLAEPDSYCAPLRRQNGVRDRINQASKIGFISARFLDG
jgi:hypothetical protein